MYNQSHDIVSYIILTEAPDSCCSKNNDGDVPSPSCIFSFGSFSSVNSSSASAGPEREDLLGCTDPVPVLTDVHATRCSFTAGEECTNEEEVCGSPDVRGLLRITVAGESGEKVLLWNGPRAEVREQGEFDGNSKVVDSDFSISLKKWWWIDGGRGFGSRVCMLLMRRRDFGGERDAMERQEQNLILMCRYLEMAALSLYFLNLLPLPYLDGMELLRCLVQSRGRLDVEERSGVGGRV